MFNTSGEILFHLDQPAKQIDISDLSSGVYFLKLQGKEGCKLSGKIVKFINVEHERHTQIFFCIYPGFNEANDRSLSFSEVWKQGYEYDFHHGSPLEKFQDRRW